MAHLIFRLVAATAAALVLCGCSAPPSSVHFAQSHLERERWAGGAIEPPIAPDVRALALTKAEITKPLAVFTAVLRACPDTAVVYPSERYYYWEATVEGEAIRGNIRLTDAEGGLAHTGYYSSDRPGDFFSATFGEADGVSVTPAGPDTFTVGVGGTSKRFVLDPAWRADGSWAVRPGESAVTSLIDESGFGFVLAWNEPEHSFFFVTDPRRTLREEYRTVCSEPEIIVGEPSGFAFWRQPAGNDAPGSPARLVLVGVRTADVAANSSFDGPFDQVPPRLPLRDMLERAYPYVRYGRGIDSFGGFVETPGSRVAISPYMTYSSMTDLVTGMKRRWDRARGLASSRRLLNMTFDTKRAFHLRLEGRGIFPDAGAHVQATSEAGGPRMTSPR